jgi:phosphoglycolate phosphatase-like HAD superfamily hydrolase
VLLWDIDGTLIEHAPAKRDRHAHAVTQVLGIPTTPVPQGVGKTDRQIVTELLTAHTEPTHEVIGDVLAHLDDITDSDLLTSPASALPGVMDALAYMSGMGARHLLLTGNTPRRAEAKVRSAGLASYFDITAGFYGHAHATRMDLVAEAVDHLDSDALTNTIIIGDTPLDITAARSGGVKVIAVATGAVSEQELAEHNPDGLLPSIDAAVFAALVDHILRT